MPDQLKARVRALKREAYTIYLAARDPRTPWYAKALIFFVIAYTFSPIDLIPDFVPILGYLDDLIITPAGIWLALQLIPSEVIVEARATAKTYNVDRGIGKVGAMIIILLWLIAVVAAAYFFMHFTKRI